jgi:aryl-alcohol dehydrogenase-like predicted oxidoreductase
VLHVAISDAPAWFVAQCQTLANVHALSPFILYQGRYSACDRDAEAEVFPMLDVFKISYVPWSVLAAGKLATRSREGSARGAGELTPLEAKVQQAIFEVSERIGKPMAQVAISWCATRVPSVMVGARKVEQIRDAIAALSFRLSRAFLLVCSVTRCRNSRGRRENLRGRQADVSVPAQRASNELAEEAKCRYFEKRRPPRRGV